MTMRLARAPFALADLLAGAHALAAGPSTSVAISGAVDRAFARVTRRAR
jgi:hypothetical protein